MLKIHLLLLSSCLVLLAQPQVAESYNKLRAKHLSQTDGPLKKNYNYVEIRSSDDLKKFIKDGCVNVGLNTENGNRGRKINYVSIQNVKFDATSLCKDFEGVNFGIISDEAINTKLTNFVKIKNTVINDSVNAGIIISGKNDRLENAQLTNNILINNTELGDRRKNRNKQHSMMRSLRKEHKHSIHQRNQEMKGSPDADNEAW